MKSKITVLLCISFVMITVLGCGSHADATEADTVNATALVASVMSGADEAILQKAVDAANEVINAAAEERISLSWDEFRDKVLNDCDYDISEEELQVLYQEIRDSEILKGENRQLTGLALNDYDQNGQTDMIVCSLNNGDGYIYFFMNGKSFYDIRDEYCCYKSGDIFCDFGADIDHDQNIEVVFCVGGTKIDCVKFVVKPMDKGIKRMELPYGLYSKDDYGEELWVEKGLEEGVYEVRNMRLAEKVALKVGEQKKIRDWSSSGYYKLALEEYQGEVLLAGYEYIYLGDVVLGSAVFLFDWNENGEAYVKAWYVEDNEGKRHISFGKIQKSKFDYTNIFDENETGEEVKAYEEFITGKIAANIDDNIYTKTSYIGIAATDPKVMDKDGQGFYFEDLIDGIIKETMDGWNNGNGIWAVQYALIDCGSDGKKQLALRAYGLGIGGTCDDSDLTMVFDYKDGKIFMVYAVDAWSRSSRDLYKNGYVHGFGSDGAFSNYEREGIIKADGVYHESFQCHMWVGGSEWEFLDINDKRRYQLESKTYSISGETIEAYDIDDADITEEVRQAALECIQKRESSLGVDILSDDKAWELVEKNRKSLGITEGMDTEENKIEWRVLPRLTTLSQ